jgi:hypothetical protein
LTTDFNAASWSASELLTDVLRAARLPDSGTIDYTPTVVLRMATDAIWNWAAHQTSTAREGRGLTQLSRTVATASISARGDVFELPPMAVADGIDAVYWQDDAGGQQTPLALIPDSLLPVFAQASDSSSTRPDGYTLRDGTIKVFPRCTSGTLVISYQRRHGQLVVGSDTAVVVSVANQGGFARVTLSGTPSAFVANAWVDVIGSNHPYRTKLHGARITSVVGGNVFDLSAAYADVTPLSAVGDVVVTYGKTPYVSLPLEMRPSLTQHVAANILAELGDASMVGMYDARAEAGAARTRDMLSPRSKADRPKMVNPHSLARGALAGRRRIRTDSF